MLNQLRVAILGAGKIAELGHLPGYVQAGAAIVAVCDTDASALQRLGDKYQIDRRHTDWRQMLAMGGFDAVSICTPPSLHADMAVASAQHGYHVLVEKPMALTLNACDRMIEAARSANKLLMVSHNQRCAARHVIAKRILDSGRLGRPYVARATFAHGGPENWSPRQTWYFDAGPTTQGVMADLGSHKIDLLRWLLGQEVTEVSAFGATFEKATKADDTAVLSLRFSGGTLASIYVSWAQRPRMTDDLAIQCERGTLLVPTDASEPVRVLEPGQGGTVAESVYAFDAAGEPGWLAAVAAFVDAVTNHKQSPVSGEDGRATMAAVLAAYDAFANRRVVQLMLPSRELGGS